MCVCVQVATYITQKCANNFQCIVISLKEEFYARADALVGIYSEVCLSLSLCVSVWGWGFMVAEIRPLLVIIAVCYKASPFETKPLNVS